MNTLVIGGTGFLGRRVVPRLIARGHAVSGLARSVVSATALEGTGARAVTGDLDRDGDVAKALAASDADALVMLATLGLGHAPGIVRAAEAASVGRAVFVSTTGIFTSLRTATKQARIDAERCITASALRWTIVRPTMIYGGPDDRNMARLLRFLARSPVVPLPGGGRTLQQPVHVEDLADLIVTALGSDVAVGKTYDVAGPRPLSLREVIELSADAVGRRVRLAPVPLAAATALVRAYERASRTPRLRAEQLERLAEDKAYDITAARTDLGYDPRAFHVGIREEARQLAGR